MKDWEMWGLQALSDRVAFSNAIEGWYSSLPLQCLSILKENSTILGPLFHQTPLDSWPPGYGTSFPQRLGGTNVKTLRDH